MADRMHPYPMFPQNITSSSLQQSQIPQQPPQSQQPDPQMISALSNPEHSHMWPQMNHLRNTYRSQQSGDLAASQMNHQLQEFARGQALSHGQGQPIVPQIQQSFGLNAQRMNPSGPAFHDPQSSQPQSLIPPNFPNMHMNTQMKAPFTMNPMMHPAMGNPALSRQLKVLNQQEMARLQQSGLGVQHAPNQPTAVDMFASSSMQSAPDQVHGSPHPTPQPAGLPGSNQGMVPGNQQAAVQRRIITPADFQERRNYLGSLVSQSENNLALVQTACNTNPADPHLQQKLNQLRGEVASRRDMYTKFVASFGAMVTQQMANGMPPSSLAHLNPMTHSTSQQPQQATVSNSQVQPGFITQANQSVAAPFKFPAGNGTSSMPAQTQGALNQQIPVQPTPIGRPNTIPPRTGGTPHQISAGTLPNTMSPNLGNFAASAGQKVADQARQSADIMPLDEQRFKTTYHQFCRSQNLPLDLQVPIGDRTVDLHLLHAQVIRAGGATSVTQRDMWAVIGGRLNFIQFPGNDTEPARCGPGIAQQLKNTYEQLLQHFENAYYLTVQNRSTTGSPQQPIHQNPLTISNNVTAGISGTPTEMPPNPPRLPSNQQFISMALRHVLMSAQEMRAQHVPETLINFVEHNRSDLMKLYQQQVQQMIAKRNAEQEQQNIANAQGPLPNLHEQASIGLQPGVQRLPQPIGANPIVGMAGESKMVNGAMVSDNAAVALQKQPPTQDQIQHAVMAIGQIRQTFQQRSLAVMVPQHIPEEQRSEYNQLLEQVYRMTLDLDGRLPMYLAVIKNEELLRRYVAIVMTVARQRQLLSTPSPQYIISPSTLRTMQAQIHKLNEEFENRWRVMKTSAVAAQQHTSFTSAPARVNPASLLSVPPMQNISQVAPPTLQGNGRSASMTPQRPLPPQSHIQPPLPPQSHSQANQAHPHSQPQSMPQQIKKNFQSSIPPSPSAPPPSSTLASPTPPPAAATASSSTPATSAPTPQPTSSPQTPKSPPSKAAVKTKAPSRVNRKLSAASKGPATPEMVPSVAGVKRPPEEDVAALTSVAPSEAEVSNAPSPKKAKTEWEGEMSEALLKKQQETDSIKTDEDATVFFDRMKELFAMSASADNEAHHDIASTLDQILAVVPMDAAATAAALSVHGAGDAGPPPTALSPHMGPANDAFLLEFLDLSSFPTLDDDDDSKAPTPDLVPSSETNPSPESGSEGDSLGTGSPDKTKMDELSDPLRLGSLREIDGGESAYYQAGDWKWEGTMPTLDQPWAIFTS